MIENGKGKRLARVILVIALLTMVGWASILLLQHKEPVAEGAVTANPGPEAIAAARSTFYKAVCSNQVKLGTVGTLQDKDLAEVSGLAASDTIDDGYWVLNDSGNEPVVYGIDGSGRLLGSLELDGIRNQDWEDMAVGPGPQQKQSYIYIADTGDNMENRGSVTIYRTPEVDFQNQSQGTGDTKASAVTAASSDSLRFTYPDGLGHNVEAMFVDRTSGKIYLIDKASDRPARIFEAPAGLADGSTTKLAQVGTLGFALSGGRGYQRITGADIAPDGSTIAVRTYESLYVYDRPADTPIAQALQGAACHLPQYSEPQGETAAFSRDGTALLSVSEGKGQPLHRFSVQ